MTNVLDVVLNHFSIHYTEFGAHAMYAVQNGEQNSVNYYKQLSPEHKKKLIGQVNNAPKELKDFVHALEAGCDGSLLMLMEQYRQENEEMKFVIEQYGLKEAQMLGGDISVVVIKNQGYEEDVLITEPGMAVTHAMQYIHDWWATHPPKERISVNKIRDKLSGSVDLHWDDDNGFEVEILTHAKDVRG